MYYSALIGHPVEHSISPVLFAYLAKQTGLEYSHTKIDVVSEKKLSHVLSALADLGFCGVNVTLPYKLTMQKYLYKVSPEARKIGAVNSVVFKKGRLFGYNTDAYGALKAIETQLKKVKAADRILILGAGGAARAIIYPLYKITKNIVVLNRDIGEAAELSRDLSGGKIKYEKLSDSNIRQYLPACNIIINSTPVGMYPAVGGEIISRTIYQDVPVNGKYFFDAIFNPYHTKFLEYAHRAGAKTCSGTYMMIYQAQKAFALWTGRRVPAINAAAVNNIMRRALKY
ncbi:MAG: shikimate dehydrogenase [Patescibacteria group bacterium]